MDLEGLGQKLSQLMKTYHETTYSLGKKLGLSPPTISRYTRGANKPKMTTIKAIADYFDVNPDWLMGRSTNYFREEPIKAFEESAYSTITVFEEITYDLPLLSNKRSDIEFKLPFDIVNGWGPAIAFKVPDDAMAPYLHKGNIAVIELDPKPCTQNFSAFHVADSDLMIRKTIIQGSKVIVQPSNLDFDAQVFSRSNIQMIGRVVYSRAISEHFFSQSHQILSET